MHDFGGTRGARESVWFVAREGVLGPRHHQLRRGEGSTDRITNHFSLRDKLVSLVRGEILLQSTKERG